MASGECALRLTRRYAEPPEVVWAVVADPAARGRWLAPGFEVAATEVEPGRVLELDWQPPGEERSLVRVELRPDGGGTVLVLDHSRIEAARGMRALGFWTGALAGVPLQERA